MDSEPVIDNDVDIDELFVYDESLSAQENYEIWLSHIYDTFAGIANGDNYIEIIEAFANEKNLSIKFDLARFKDVNGLPPAINELICYPPQIAEDLLFNKAQLSLVGAVDYRLNLPLKIRLELKSHNAYGAELSILKQGEDNEEPIDIFNNGVLVCSLSPNDFLSFLISLNEFDAESSVPEIDLLLLSSSDRDALYVRLLRLIGIEKGTVIESDKLYGPLTFGNTGSSFANGVVAVNQIETTAASITNIEIVKHDLLSDLDCEVIYRLSAEIYGGNDIVANSTDTNTSQKVQKIVHAPASFNVRKIVANMEFEGKVTPMELTKTNIVMMIKVVQDLVSNIVDRIDTPNTY